MKKYKTQHQLLLLVFCISIISCKKENTYKVDGIVVNKITQEPLEGVRIRLQDGIAVGGILPNEVDSKAETFTASDGSFSVKITTKSNHAVLYLSKEAYEYKLEGSTSDTRHYGISDEYTFVKLGMDGLAYFNPIFFKKYSTPKDNDTLRLIVFSYENMIDWLRGIGTPQEFRGKGVFSVSQNPFTIPQVKGDRYLRYKLEFTNNGEWQTKIDSVFLPTSIEVYRDTIYY